MAATGTLTDMYWDHMNGWDWITMILWSLVWISLVGLIAWVAIPWARNGPEPPRPDQAFPIKTARELLDERLARGEIDPDEYRLRREALDTHPPVGLQHRTRS